MENIADKLRYSPSLESLYEAIGSREIPSRWLSFFALDILEWGLERFQESIAWELDCSNDESTCNLGERFFEDFKPIERAIRDVIESKVKQLSPRKSGKFFWASVGKNDSSQLSIDQFCEEFVPKNITFKNGGRREFQSSRMATNDEVLLARDRLLWATRSAVYGYKDDHISDAFFSNMDTTMRFLVVAIGIQDPFNTLEGYRIRTDRYKSVHSPKGKMRKLYDRTDLPEGYMSERKSVKGRGGDDSPMIFFQEGEEGPSPFRSGHKSFDSVVDDLSQRTDILEVAYMCHRLASYIDCPESTSLPVGFLAEGFESWSMFEDRYIKELEA